MNPAALILGLIGLVGLAIRARPGRHTKRDLTRTKFDIILARIKLRTATIADVEKGAELATQLGLQAEVMRLTALATAMKKKLREKNAAAAARAKPVPVAPKIPALVKSPLPKEVPEDAWREYTREMGTSTIGHVSPQYRLGVFQVSLPGLADLGFVKDLSRGKAAAVGDYDGKTEVYTATWVPPYSLERFLSDAPLQVQAWNQQNLSNWARVRDRHVLELGSTILGQEVTGSGLLAVAAMGGPKGLDSFIKQTDEQRKKYPRTVAKFLETNGLF